MSMIKMTLVLGSVWGFLSVALGAFGAHGLKERLDVYQMGVYQTGVQYQFFHAIMLVVLGTLMLKSPDISGLKWAAICFNLGILIFSGSLYLIALTGVKAWGAVTPIGGVFFLVAWILMATGFFRSTI